MSGYVSLTLVLILGIVHMVLVVEGHGVQELQGHGGVHPYAKGVTPDSE